MKILVVDENPAHRNILRVALNLAGHETVDAGDGVEALEKLRAETLDAVISDVLMPRMDGYRLCYEVRRSDGFHDIPFIIYTSTYTSPADESVALKLGVDRFIRKPAAPAAVLAELTELLRTPRKRDAVGSLAGDSGSAEEKSQGMPRKGEEEALRESEERYRGLFENNLAGVFRSTADGQLLECNYAFARMFGYESPEEIKAEPLYNLYPSPQARKLFVQKVLERGSVTNIESFCVRKDGSPIWSLDNTRIIPQPDGSPAILEGTIIDITSRKEAEQALIDSEIRYRRLFEAAKDGILILDFDTGRVTDVNPFLSTLLGFSRDEIVGNTVGELSPFRGIASNEIVLERLQKDEYVRYEDLPLETRDGRKIAVEFISNVYQVGDRRVIQCNVRDITERKQAQQAFRESEARYREIFDASPLPKWIFRVPDARILDVNRAAIDHYGYSREEFLQLTLFDLRPPEEGDRLRETIKADGDRPAGGPAGIWKHRKKDGTVIDVEVFTHSVVLGGDNVQLAVILDVTERLRLEEQFRHAQKMEAIGRLAGGIAHDFNNILMVVQGIADVFPLHAGNEAEQQRDLENLRMAAQRGGALTRQILAFSRQRVLQTEILDAGAVVKDLSPMIERLVGEDLELTVKIARDAGAVSMDRSQLDQIVMNLVVNARDAMPSGGRLSIEVSAAVLDSAYASVHPGARPGSYVLITVSDSGIGMDREVQKNIFQPFFTTKELGRGTGLGLATVYGIVKNLRGNIWVYSEPGHGSVFKVYLPLAEDAGDTQRSTSEAAVSVPGNETILIVENEATIRQMMETYLSARGYRILSASDGIKAIELLAFEAGPIHVVVTDVVLPGRGGREVASAALERDPKTRVIFMSGYTDDAEVVSAIVSKGLDFLQKPFPLEVLAGRIRAAIDRVR